MSNDHSLSSASILVDALELAQHELLDARESSGHWTGRLAASALSTATAVSALSVCANAGDDSAQLRERINRGLQWLNAAQNEDGGFGDTDRSPSNIASSFLVLAAWHLAEPPERRVAAIQRLQAYIDEQNGWEGLRRRYGKDKTFVVPIMSNCAIAGLTRWSNVSPLPFELAAFPQQMYRFLQMPVVSYAIPALVAIGQARYAHAGTWNPITWVARYLTRGKTLRVLRAMQPESGGYLEATPLTSFVLMNLASMGLARHAVSQQCVKFLLSSQLEDGSWPIDENLATWLTSLSVTGLCNDPECDTGRFAVPELVQWHLKCQHRVRHPFTGADPGGWGWTDLSGAVPDADDTPAAILALTSLQDRKALTSEQSDQVNKACDAGVDWLLGLQNRDGGWPTFCRGWGKLPFDRSGSDLTAHAMRALHARKSHVDHIEQGVTAALDRGLRYLERAQAPDGSWLPLWFGNHDCHDDENKIYGTGRVLLAYQDLGLTETKAYLRGLDYLIQSQNPDGGWGGGKTLTEWLRQQGLPDVKSSENVPLTSSIEESAVALEALAGSGDVDHLSNIVAGVLFLQKGLKDQRHQNPWPIGFYFAKLWYHEQLYPLIYTVAALGKVKQTIAKHPKMAEMMDFSS